MRIRPSTIAFGNRTTSTSGWNARAWSRATTAATTKPPMAWLHHRSRNRETLSCLLAANDREQRRHGGGCADRGERHTHGTPAVGRHALRHQQSNADAQHAPGGRDKGESRKIQDELLHRK